MDDWIKDTLNIIAHDSYYLTKDSLKVPNIHFPILLKSIYVHFAPEIGRMHARMY